MVAPGLRGNPLFCMKFKSLPPSKWAVLVNSLTREGAYKDQIAVVFARRDVG